jgi:hypothetical protein
MLLDCLLLLVSYESHKPVVVDFSIAKRISHVVDYPIQSSVVHHLAVYVISLYLAKVCNTVQTYYLTRIYQWNKLR